MYGPWERQWMILKNRFMITGNLGPDRFTEVRHVQGKHENLVLMYRMAKF
jgi:hypothetical protein